MVVVGSQTEAWEPNVLTRPNHILGARYWGGLSRYMDGTIAYVKVWHGVELTESDVGPLFICPTGLFGNKLTSCVTCPDGQTSAYPHTASCCPCPAGAYSTGGTACTVCAAGTYQASPGSSSCTTCPSGKYQPDKVTSADLHTPCTSCSPGTKLEDDTLFLITMPPTISYDAIQVTTAPILDHQNTPRLKSQEQELAR